ncbi:hypothetical protein R1sor_002449 [Riccia sorocarpa]|uniref:Uncharacterized protein n=1 Tax=Riccia sorocarpa TaxID=122646 RepID=A0ABD3H1Z9_9MARC
MDEEGRGIHDLRMEVLSLRKMTEDDQHSPLLDRLKKVEDELRKMEHEEARAWRMRSRTRCLREGEAPTRYFYAQTKAKFSREAIQALKLNDGRMITEKTEVLGQVEDYYKQLYTGETATAQTEEARTKALRQLTKTITPQQDQVVAQKPTGEEVKKIVQVLKTDKSPGLDGVTVELETKEESKDYASTKETTYFTNFLPMTPAFFSSSTGKPSNRQ